ncbi:MAG: two-component regulator propeller domain-containing protein, partial [Bacteroidota bacterium]
MKNTLIKSVLTFFSLVTTFSFFSQLSVSAIYDMTTTGGVFTSNVFRTVAVDIYGDVWAGTNGQKLYRFNGNLWEPAASFTTHSFRYITPDPNGGIWVAQSGSTGTDAVNGGVDFLDSTYARTHYGAIDGLASRFTYALTRMENGDIVSVHTPNTTAGVVSGGGISIISNGVASSILNGLPSGTFAEDRSCYSVGTNGSTEFWVSVGRSCNTSGVCNYGYIARYDNTGNHLGNFDINNSPIPFTNSSASVIARSIHFTNDNKVFVGLFSGGIAVYDLSLNVWTIINETNSLFPAGASVNFQAIYSSGNEVYIGTNAGLLIYNSNGVLTNSASYQLINTNTGLPSNNVNGIFKGPNGHIWLATSAGIVEMTSSTLTGSVNDSQANFGLGSISHLPLNNAKVYLKDMTTGLYVDSVVTGVSGEFTFSFPTSGNSIQLEAFHVLNLDTFSCKIPNVVPSNINVNLTEGLLQQVIDSLPSLTTFKTEQSYFWDLIQTFPEFQGYDVSGLQANLSQFKELSPQNYQNELEVLARLIIFKEVMQSYGYNGLEVSSNLISATTDFLKGIYSDVFAKQKLNLDAGVEFSNAKKEIFKLALDQAEELIITPLIIKLCSYINDISLRNTIQASVQAVVQIVITKAKLDAGENLSTALIVSEVQESLTNYLNTVFNQALFENYYISQTKFNVNNAVENL